ncbi:MAG: hypothetical protein KatS3mg057_0039 [Herpetosiphonaceae bacterium]|nr:MAG: hypothetical protein KatS3mg057_0039 [Herpetosiphonaceae bacterium]
MSDASAHDLQFRIQLGVRALPYLADHRVGEVLALPAAAFLEMALAAGTSASRGQPCSLADMSFHELLLLDDETPRTARVTLSAESDSVWRFTIESLRSSNAGDEHWALHTSGLLRCDQHQAQPPLVALPEVLARCSAQLSASEHYTAMRERGLHYGPSFQAVEAIWRRDDEALSQLRLPETLLGEARLYNIHPVLLDAAIQSVSATRPAGTEMSLPVGLKSLILYNRPRPRLWSHSIIAEHFDDGSFMADITLIDESGAAVAALRELRIQPVRQRIAVASASPAAPRPGISSPQLSNDNGVLEQTLITIWKDVLGIRELDQHERFSDLGGDSITATQIADRAGRAGLEISPKDILETQTITKLISAINARKGSAS